MASKGQKFKLYSPEFKEMILKEYKDGASSRFLAKKYNMSYHTIDNWVLKAKRMVDVSVDHRKGGSGRPKSKNLTLEDYKERYEILKKYQAFLQARRVKK